MESSQPVGVITPETKNEGRQKNQILILGLSLVALLLVVGIVVGFIYLINPTNKLFETPITQTSLLEVIKNSKNPMAISEEVYERYLTFAVDGEKFPKYTKTGNLLARIDGGYVSLVFSPIPNASLGNKQVFVYIDSIKNGEGKEVSSQDFNTEFFTSVDVEGLSSPVAHMRVEQDLDFIEGYDEDDAASVSGRLVLKLPLGIATTTLTTSNVGKGVVTEHGTITVNEFGTGGDEGYDISLTYEGFGEKLLATVPIDASGKEMEYGWSKRIDEGYGTWDIVLHVDERAAEVVVTEVGGTLIKEIPFLVEQPVSPKVDVVTDAVSGVVESQNGGGAVTNEEKQLIVKAEEARYSIFKSRDLKIIRPFLEKVVLDPDVKDALAKSTDEQILEMIDFMLSSEMYASPGAAKKALLDPSTEWTRISDTVIEVKIDFGGGNTLTVSYRKVNGVWL